MTSPTRLLDSAQNPNARALLRAGLEEGPQPGALRATALALGVTASLALTAPATAMVAPSLALVTAKWVAVGTLAGVALAGGVNALTTPVAEAPARSPTSISPGPRELPAPLPVVRALPSVPAAPAELAPPAVARSPASVSKPAEPPPLATTLAVPDKGARPDRPDLAVEVATIDAARRALAGGDARAALAQLEQYDARERTGTLDREAQLLRIDALLGAGQRAGAHQLAAQYLGRFPQDPHAARLRALVGDRSGAAQTRPE